MGYRNIFIANPAKLSVKNEQLVIDNGESRSLPLEDIESIVFDNLRTDISTMTISKLAEHKITVFFPDEKHLPTAVLLPFCGHSRHLSMLEAQINLSKVQSKRLWSEIVKAKISNQGKVLKLLGKEGGEKLDSLSSKVKSGDIDNMEAVAAATYFPLLFGVGFHRSEDTVVNGLLNYGYAIFRSTAAKLISAYGFEPSLGLFHHSMLNQFNLADDIMEPFRPIVDLFVACSLTDCDTITTREKGALLNLLNMNVCEGGKKYAASYAMERCVGSLYPAFAGETRLILPELMATEQHHYE